MLPERLSNGVCSLSPDEDKLTYSCFMEISPRGKLVDYSVEEAVITQNSDLCMMKFRKYLTEKS
jgi:exoribonuclease R